MGAWVAEVLSWMRATQSRGCICQFGGCSLWIGGHKHIENELGDDEFKLGGVKTQT